MKPRRAWALAALCMATFYGAVMLASWVSGCADIGTC